jgi:hypothetical protein
MMTSNLVTAVATSNGESWDAILGRVSMATNLSNSGQTPTVEGASRRYPFSLAEADADAGYIRPTLAVSGAIAGRSQPVIRRPSGIAEKDEALVAGLSSIFREQTGIPCDVYPAFLVGVGEPKGRVQMTGELIVTCLKEEGGRPVGETPFSVAKILSGEVAEGDRLLPRATRVPLARPKVCVRCAPELREPAVALFRRLQAETSVEVVDGGEVGSVDYFLSVIKAEGKLLVRVFNRGGTYLGVFGGTEAEVIQKACAYVVTRHKEATRLIRLHNPSAPFRVRVKAVGGEGVRRPGELVVNVSATEPCYIYVWAAVGETAAAKAMYESDGLQAPTQMLSCTIGTGPAFFGRLVIKAIATKQPLDFKAMQAASDPSGELLRQLQAAFPGGAAELVSTDGWADEMASFEFPK